MQQPKMTRHGMERLQQRGARAKDVAIVMAYGDIDVPARDDCRFIQLSQRAVTWLLQQKAISVQDVDRAKRLVVLVNSSDQVVTVLKRDPEKRMREPALRRGRR